jgi:hypothetical protein
MLLPRLSVIERWSMMNPFRCALALVPLLAASPAGAVQLVAEGQARAVIVTPAQQSPAAKRAAVILREHVRQISGAALPIRTEREVNGEPTAREAWVLVGEGPLANKLGFTTETLGPGGVLVEAKGHVLALLGTDARTPGGPERHPVRRHPLPRREARRPLPVARRVRQSGAAAGHR